LQQVLTHCTPSHGQALTVLKATSKANNGGIIVAHILYLLLLPRRIGGLHFGRVVGKGGDVLVSLRTEFLSGVPCRAACNTKCVCLCVCVCMFVCVLSAHRGRGGTCTCLMREDRRKCMACSWNSFKSGTTSSSDTG